MKFWYDANDHAIELIGLKNGATDTWVNSADVAATLYDSDGNALSGVAWPLTMSYVNGSNGTYRAIIDKALVVSARERITAVVTAALGDIDATWEEILTVTKRRSWDS